MTSSNVGMGIFLAAAMPAGIGMGLLTLAILGAFRFGHFTGVFRRAAR
ncbi:hypothetical protein NHH03_16670 [Stieleria sp. TO1_6]|nr:hypothetical protein [Stieleria tagensis]MCO8123386.1 hypothetical protein [Stieleria tagensis]